MSDETKLRPDPVVRAKFQIVAITEYDPRYRGRGKTVRLEARYDNLIPEDIRFQEATPTGSLEVFVTNEKALERLQIGTSFYLDFVLVPVDAP